MNSTRESGTKSSRATKYAAFRIFAFSILHFAFSGRAKENLERTRGGGQSEGMREGGRGWPRRHNCTIVNCPPLPNRGTTTKLATYSSSMPSLSEEVRGRAKERELSLVREVLSGLIGCASAALCLRAVEGREIQTGDISFARACRSKHTSSVRTLVIKRFKPRNPSQILPLRS